MLKILVLNGAICFRFASFALRCMARQRSAHTTASALWLMCEWTGFRWYHAASHGLWAWTHRCGKNSQDLTPYIFHEQRWYLFTWICHFMKTLWSLLRVLWILLEMVVDGIAASIAGNMTRFIPVIWDSMRNGEEHETAEVERLTIACIYTSTDSAKNLIFWV